MIIRRLMETDAEAVSGLIIKTLMITNIKDYPREMMEELAERQKPADVLARAGQTHFYVAEDNGHITGCGAIGPYRGKEDESCLFSIFVLPEYQGQGIGRGIVETLEKDEYFLRAKRIEVPASITGLEFYRKLGYDYKNGSTEMDEERLYRLEKCRKNVHIRRMTMVDYDRVYALWMSCRNMGFNNLDDSREGICRYLKRNPSTCFIAEDGTAIVGVILTGHDGRRGFIHHLAVKENYRRQGIAADLLDRAVSALRAEGINKAALLVFNRNKDGNAFWESQGFYAREDITYRNKELAEIVRIDT